MDAPVSLLIVKLTIRTMATISRLIPFDICSTFFSSKYDSSVVISVPLEVSRMNSDSSLIQDTNGSRNPLMKLDFWIGNSASWRWFRFWMQTAGT